MLGRRRQTAHGVPIQEALLGGRGGRVGEGKRGGNWLAGWHGSGGGFKMPCLARAASHPTLIHPFIHPPPM